MITELDAMVGDLVSGVNEEAADVFGFEYWFGETVFCDQEHSLADLLGGENLTREEAAQEGEDRREDLIEDSI